ncbi:hypothetical protein [Hoyosella altamirensis]|uniref:hypothetical protein n=1 Tax=Hoyosella altamirensis TaxID=616997 RepID=UPI00094458D4|nr:hypothetical protein [Hoyosella altamirensis]
MTSNNLRIVSGIELRYVLTWTLLRFGQMTVSELAESLHVQGFGTRGRTSKNISDALRWEVGKGRVRRRGRGLYGPGSMPRQTESRIRDRVRGMRERATATSSSLLSSAA